MRKERVFRQSITWAPLALLVLAAGLYLALAKEHRIEIGVSGWNHQGRCSLGTTAVSYEMGTTEGLLFVPKQKEAFEKQAEAHEGFLGVRAFPVLGLPEQKARYFYSEGGCYVLYEEGADEKLMPAMTVFTLQSDSFIGDFAYPAPGFFAPEESGSAAHHGALSFALVFGTFEEACEQFYRYYDESEVAIDAAKQTITTRVFDVLRNREAKGLFVCLDFAKREAHVVFAGADDD